MDGACPHDSGIARKVLLFSLFEVRAMGDLVWTLGLLATTSITTHLLKQLCNIPNMLRTCWVTHIKLGLGWVHRSYDSRGHGLKKQALCRLPVSCVHLSATP